MDMARLEARQGQEHQAPNWIVSLSPGVTMWMCLSPAEFSCGLRRAGQVWLRTDAGAQQSGLESEQAKWLDDELRDRDLARTKGCDPAHTNPAPVSDASGAPTRTHVSGQHNRLKLPTSRGRRSTQDAF